MSHWYDSEGTPQHFLGKDGKATTLREARKFDGQLNPSVTTILGITAKPALTNWIAEEAAMMAADTIIDSFFIDRGGMAVTRIIHDRSWARSVLYKSREETMKKADAGTLIHDVLEQFFLGNDVGEEWMVMCNAVHTQLTEYCGVQDWVTEQTVVDNDLGYGGKCDLNCPDFIVDFKSKDSVDAKTRGFPEQADQLAAYANGLGYPDARLINVFISRSDGTVKLFEHKDTMGWHRFKAALNLWQISKKYGKAYDDLKSAD